MSLENVDYLVVDEYHHIVADTYQSLVARAHPKFLLGLTATPYRSDRQDIFSLCDNNTLVSFSLRAGIEQGVLAPYNYYGCFDDIDYSHIRHNGRSYDARDLERHLVIPERDEAIIAKWREHAVDKPTLAFCAGVRHAKRVTDAFLDAGVPAAVYLGSTPIEARRALLQQLRAGAVKILCLVDVLNEGVDVPFVECLLFLRPTESRRIFYQQLGRGLRRSHGKRACVVIDFIGNFSNAFRIVDYHDLLPDQRFVQEIQPRLRPSKELANVPVGCTVQFDERVIDLFIDQEFKDPRFITRHNIGSILLDRYEVLAQRLGRLPTAREVDRYQTLDSSIYIYLFGNWSTFQEIARMRLARQPLPPGVRRFGIELDA